MSARRALLVASGSYTDSGLSKLRSPAVDADRLGRILRDPAIGAFDVELLLNSPYHEVGERVADFLASGHSKDTLFLYFSCHGLLDEYGDLFFACTNSRLNSLDSTATSALSIARQMGRSRSRRIVLALDCCFSGAFPAGLTPRAVESLDVREGIEETLAGQGRAVLTATSSTEYAFEAVI